MAEQAHRTRHTYRLLPALLGSLTGVFGCLVVASVFAMYGFQDIPEELKPLALPLVVGTVILGFALIVAFLAITDWGALREDRRQRNS